MKETPQRLRSFAPPTRDKIFILSDGDFKQSQNLGYIVRPHKDLPLLFGREQGTLYTEVIKFSDLLKRAQLRSKIFTDKILPDTKEN